MNFNALVSNSGRRAVVIIQNRLFHEVARIKGDQASCPWIVLGSLVLKKTLMVGTIILIILHLLVYLFCDAKLGRRYHRASGQCHYEN